MQTIAYRCPRVAQIMGTDKRNRVKSMKKMARNPYFCATERFPGCDAGICSQGSYSILARCPFQPTHKTKPNHDPHH